MEGNGLVLSLVAAALIVVGAVVYRYRRGAGSSGGMADILRESERARPGRPQPEPLPAGPSSANDIAARLVSARAVVADAFAELGELIGVAAVEQESLPEGSARFRRVDAAIRDLHLCIDEAASCMEQLDRELEGVRTAGDALPEAERARLGELIAAADALAERAHRIVLAKRSERILGRWWARHLAEVSRIEARAAEHEIAAEDKARDDE